MLLCPRSVKNNKKNMIKKILKFLSFGRPNIDDMLPFPEGKRLYREFHNLRRENMDQDALKVVNRLSRYGYRSYLVGGCVRDLILGKRPKDYDVVTTATPTQIRKVFSNSRAIGRRFKIVHVIFRGKIIEVSTFRSVPEHRLGGRFRKKEQDVMMTRDNEYGTPKEDAARRDFTINALYFDPRNESIIDYVGGYEDIQNRVLSVIGDPDMSFREDPVRMFRAAKFSALLNFPMSQECIRAIKRNKNEITKASPSRMLEEYAKIFRTGRSFEVFSALYETGLLGALFPDSFQGASAMQSDFAETNVGKRFLVADKMLAEREDLTTSIFIALFFMDLVKDVFLPHSIPNVIHYVKKQIEPLARKIQLPGKDKERLLHMFISQNRFHQKDRKKKQETFRQKIFFYESFMVFKIHAITVQDEEAIQKAMFWEFGPRTKPPEPSKIITTFFPRNNSHNKDRPQRPRPRGASSRRSASGEEKKENIK